MQYTPHYNLNLPEGTDIVNPLVQDNPNYTTIDTALYNNKLRVVGTATHVKTGTNHAITLDDSDINQFKFVATGDYATGDTFTVDGVTVTPRIADGSTIPNGAFKINSTVLCIRDGTVLNLINVESAAPDATSVDYDNTGSGLSASNVQGAIDEIDGVVDGLTAPIKGAGNYNLTGVASNQNAGWGNLIVCPFHHDPSKTITVNSAVIMYVGTVTDPGYITVYSNSDTAIMFRYNGSNDMTNRAVTVNVTLS